MPNILSLFRRAFRTAGKRSRRWHGDFERLEDRLAPAGHMLANNGQLHAHALYASDSARANPSLVPVPTGAQPPVSVNDAYTAYTNKTLTVAGAAAITSLTMQSQPG